MFSPIMKERLRDPDYLELHLVAASAVQQIGETPWYDAHFLKKFECAKLYLQSVRPDAVEHFIAGFAPLRTPKDFALKAVADLFSANVYDQIKQIAESIPKAQLELHEVENFGRNIVHDHAYFSQLQKQLTPLVGELAGCEVVPGYNFLSLYGSAGRCDPHLDEPISMFTLDFCINQDVEWPIYFSDIIDWPDAAAMKAWDPKALLNDKSLNFTAKTLQPNQAILFSGSGQWHYREAMPAGGFCNLLFFHYYPAGCEKLVIASGWPEYFDLPELQPLCDLFVEIYPDQS